MQSLPVVAGSLAVGILAAFVMLVSGKHSDLQDGSGSNDHFLSVALVIASVVIFLLVGFVSREIPLTKEPRIKLGTPGYDLAPCESPTVSGFLLLALTKLVANNYFGHIIIRVLLNDNRPDQLRDLARQASAQDIPAIDLPLSRTDDRTVSDEMAKTAIDAIQNGLVRSYTANDVVGVMDYYEAYKSGSIKPSEVIAQQVFDAMDKFMWMNMFIACDREDVLKQAKESDERWKRQKPLSIFDGVPIAVKDDMVKVKGLPLTNGMPLRDSDPLQTKDDVMVRRFRDAGAIILGKTNMTEFGRCPLGYNSHYKGPFNPYDERCYTGGSSSGSVCSVMTGLVPIAISFDGGGSIRIPAALSGAFGLAPTFGRIPFDSDICMTGGVTHAGVNTATTTDTALAYSLLAQNEPGHLITQLYGSEGPPRPHLSDFEKIDDFSDLKVGVMWPYFNDCDPEIARSCKAVIDELQQRGAKVVEVSIPHLNALALAHSLNISVLFSAVEEANFYHRSDIEPATKIQLQLGKVVTGVELMATNRLRAWAMQYIKKLFAEQMDVFILPGCPIVAPRIPPAALAHGESNLVLTTIVMRFVFLVNLAGFPGMTLPVAYSEAEKLPISIQFMADHWNDPLLLRLSHFVEKRLFRRKAPKHFVKMNLKCS